MLLEYEKILIAENLYSDFFFPNKPNFALVGNEQKSISNIRDLVQCLKNSSVMVGL